MLGGMLGGGASRAQRAHGAVHVTTTGWRRAVPAAILPTGRFRLHPLRLQRACGPAPGPAQQRSAAAAHALAAHQWAWARGIEQGRTGAGSRAHRPPPARAAGSTLRRRARTSAAAGRKLCCQAQPARQGRRASLGLRGPDPTAELIRHAIGDSASTLGRTQHVHRRAAGEPSRGGPTSRS